METHRTSCDIKHPSVVNAWAHQQLCLAKSNPTNCVCCGQGSPPDTHGTCKTCDGARYTTLRSPGSSSSAAAAVFHTGKNTTRVKWTETPAAPRPPRGTPDQYADQWWLPIFRGTHTGLSNCGVCGGTGSRDNTDPLASHIGVELMRLKLYTKGLPYMDTLECTLGTVTVYFPF